MNAIPPTPNRRILVIDDNPAIHHDFQKILQPESSPEALDAVAAEFFDDVTAAPTAPPVAFDVDFAHQGKEALVMVEAAKAKGCPYALAYVDVRMPPGWDGIETVTNLWQICPDLQVVICTAYSDYSWDEIVARLPVSDQLLILKKPFDIIEVLQLATALTAKWHILQIARLNLEQVEKLAAARAAELFKTAALFRLIAENASDLITIWTQEGRRLYSSPSHQRVLGISSAALLDTSLSNQLHPEDREKVCAAVARSTRSGIGDTLVCRMAHRDGSWRVFDAQINPCVSESGEVAYVVIVARSLVVTRPESNEKRDPSELGVSHTNGSDRFIDLCKGEVYEINPPA